MAVLEPHAGDHSRGPADAAVTVIEYADYECPYCAREAAVLDEVMARHPDVRLIFRNFPLTQIHPYAELAAEAAEAAAAQGKFWPMHDALFANQPSLNGDTIMACAEQVGLDMDRFVQDVNDHRYIDKIRADLRSGSEAGVQGTPAFFINGRSYPGSLSAEQLDEAIAEARRG